MTSEMRASGKASPGKTYEQGPEHREDEPCRALGESALRKECIQFSGIGVFTILCNYHLHVVPIHFLVPERSPVPIEQSFPVLPFPSLCSVSVDFPGLDYFIPVESDSITAFRDWLLSLSILFSRFILL